MSTKAEAFYHSLPRARYSGGEWETIHEFIADVIADYDPDMTDDEQLNLIDACLEQLEESAQLMRAQLREFRAADAPAGA